MISLLSQFYKIEEAQQQTCYAAFPFLEEDGENVMWRWVADGVEGRIYILPQHGRSMSMRITLRILTGRNF
jgi:hypothetical protein